MNIEKVCFDEARHLAIRSPKYWLLLSKVYLSSLKKALPAKVFRAAYFFCRHIDDVLDGDREISADPKDYVESILEAMGRDQGGPEIVNLYRFAVQHLTDMAQEDENPEEHFKRVIKDGMLFDYERAQQRKILTKAELEQYYVDTFSPVMDLALMIAGSSQRVKDFPQAVQTQGHIYTIRDMERDLSQGIINIPQEELEKSGLLLNQPFGKKNVLADKHLGAWVASEVDEQQKSLELWREALADEGAKNVSIPLIWQMNTFCRLHKWGLH